MCLLGKHEWKKLRRNISNISAVITEPDYAESLKTEYDMDLQS